MIPRFLAIFKVKSAIFSWLFLFFAAFSLPLSAQIPVGSFRAHLSYYGCQSVAVTPEYVYAACPSGLLYIDKRDGGTGTFSKVDGLSETSIARIHYDSASHYLVVAYDNGNLDFLKDDRLTNVRDIKDKSITSSKNLNGILSWNGFIYLCYPFGIVSIDPTTLLVHDTWYSRVGNSSLSINQIAVFCDRFYITSERGIFSTPVHNSAIADFATWQQETDMDSSNYHAICAHGDKLYVVKGEDDQDTLFYKDSQGWHRSTISLSPIRTLATNGSELFVCSWGFAYFYDSNELETRNIWWENLHSWNDARAAVFDGKSVWIADARSGLVHNAGEQDYSEIVPGQGPYSISAYAMDCVAGTLALAPGKITETWGPSWVEPNFSYFANEKWHNCYAHDNPELTDIYDLTAVAINPQNNRQFFVGTFTAGLLQYDPTGVVAHYHRQNSPIRSTDTLEGRIGGLTFDSQNNLWSTCCYSPAPLCVRQPNGTWHTLKLGSHVTDNTTALGQIMIDSRNYKWIVVPRDGKLLVLDDNGTLDNRSDDRITNVNMNALANITTSAINCVAEDKDGEIWIGCNLGIKVIYSPANVFKQTLYAENILIEQINYVQNLFEFEEVTCITVDDGNRKWVGTAKSGVFLISENGDEQLLHFTEENSPLLSNKIYHITINRETGEVFFATSKGLISYMGTATMGKENYDEVTVFPNPVRENYRGIITVRGLMDKSFCKIADAAGNLVWQGYAAGGELTWDGKDFYGNRPATGVYFVFASDKTGKKKNVAKILFIK